MPDQRDNHRAAEIFSIHQKLTKNDAETSALFARVYQDEKYHVSYTGKILDRWRAEGRKAEVDRAIRDAKRSRFFGAWKRFGARSATGTGKGLLFLSYWTLLLPFGLLCRGRRMANGWHEPDARNRVASAGARSQF